VPIAVDAGADEATVQDVGAVFLVDILDKSEAQAALFFDAEFDSIAVAALQWSLVVDFGAGEDEVVALPVEGGKAEAEALQVFVSGVFEVVLVDRVVDNALEVAFVVADVGG